MKKYTKKIYRPKEWEVVEGTDDLVQVDELNNYDLKLTKLDFFDDKGIPFKKLLSVKLLSLSGNKRIYLDEVVSYRPYGWVEKDKNKFDLDEVETIYEYWIEIVDMENKRSMIYKLENGLIVPNSKVFEEVKDLN